MEFRLIVPVGVNENYAGPSELLNGRLWRVSEPIDPETIYDVPFNCISYVWGPSRSDHGIFDAQIPVSDETKPALEAAMAAMETLKKNGERVAEAFWVDAICVPQLDKKKRGATLESMGLIYSAATAVITILQAAIWNIISSASRNSAEALNTTDMHILEQDTWINSPWTYQELVNSNVTYFTTRHPSGFGHSVPAEQFMNCLGLSLDRWKKREGLGESASVIQFPNLNAIVDTVSETWISIYPDRCAFTALSNIVRRRYEPPLPKNQLLAALGALSRDVTWGNSSGTIGELAEKVMQVCEKRNDFSFLFTKDDRDDKEGRRWRPATKENSKGDQMSSPVALVPILCWPNWTEPFSSSQRGYTDKTGFWLNNMIPLGMGSLISNEAEKLLKGWLHGVEVSPTSSAIKSARFKPLDPDPETTLMQTLYHSIVSMGYTGSSTAHIVEHGVFFSQLDLSEKSEIELFAAASLRWAFGAPGLARWRDEEGRKYSAGVFMGKVQSTMAKDVLIL